MAVSKEQVKELLGSGLSNEIVANAVGCDPSYISQLMADEEFRAEVIAIRTTSLTANNKRDKSIDEIEDRLIKKLDESLDNIYKPNEILRAFAVLNNAKRRGTPATESTVINNTVVNLSMPVKIAQTFIKSAAGEIVEVEGQTLQTMPAATLLQQLSKRTGKDENVYAKVANYLPTAATPAARNSKSPEGS